MSIPEISPAEQMVGANTNGCAKMHDACLHGEGASTCLKAARGDAATLSPICNRSIGYAGLSTAKVIVWSSSIATAQKDECSLRSLLYPIAGRLGILALVFQGSGT